MRTSELAAQAAVNVETLRYYERLGLLSAPARSASGYRSWSPEALRAVRFVKRAQEVGFTLADIEDLLHLAGGGPERCEAVREMAHTRIDDMDRRIADLRAMRDALTQLVATCERPRDRRECPLLHTLDAVVDQQHGGDRP